MDYVTRQFINLAKKLRDDVRKSYAVLHSDLSHLSDGLEHLKETISAQGQADDKSHDTPPITVTELRTQVPIRVQTEAQRSKIETIWRAIKGALEAAGIVAAIVYAVVAYQSWQETIAATNFSARQTELSRKSLNETIKTFRLGERAWIGIANATVVKEETSFPSVITYEVDATNIGPTRA